MSGILRKTRFNRTGLDFHLVRSVVEYRQPIVFDQLIDIWVRVARIGRTSLSNLFEIHAAGADDLRTAPPSDRRRRN